MQNLNVAHFLCNLHFVCGLERWSHFYKCGFLGDHNLARAQGTTEGLYYNMAHTDSEVTQDSDKSNVSPQLQMRNSCSNERKQV